ncbi:MAG: BLUF domain-containing protein [Geminicoccales bacterium]
MTNIFLIYVSNRTDPNDAMLVRDIAIEASQNNSSLGVSGILMVVGSSFLQVLEGEEDVVDRLLNKIDQDSRHTDIRVIYRGTLPDRIFGRWSMGCVQSAGKLAQMDSPLKVIQAQVEDLCKDLTQEKGEKLRDLIVKIPKLLTDDKLVVE